MICNVVVVSGVQQSEVNGVLNVKQIKIESIQFDNKKSDSTEADNILIFNLCFSLEIFFVIFLYKMFVPSYFLCS